MIAQRMKKNLPLVIGIGVEMPDLSPIEKQQRRQRILDALPAEQSDIVLSTGLSAATIYRWIAKLHASGEVHIVSWRRSPNGGDAIPKYAAGEGRDACEIQPLSNSERHRRMRERRRATRLESSWGGVWARLVQEKSTDGVASCPEVF